MMNQNQVYFAIDLKSFYASVECVDRHLDPMKTCLIVADAKRCDKTICLAATPAMKSFGFSSRARVFEINQKLKSINQTRRLKSPYGKFIGKSDYLPDLVNDFSLELSYIMAPPRMKRYMEVSTQIVEVYQKYFSMEDIHIYSIDEVFIDATPYLKTMNTTPKQYLSKVIQDVYKTTGITATAGIANNLYLVKVALDILAKHAEPDENGVRIAELDETTYRSLLWNHQPLTDFWRVGRGISKRLEDEGLYTMGDVARYSLTHQVELYKMFGVNAELLIDHAWGYESTKMKDIKSYTPIATSLGCGQVLHSPYSAEKARIIVREMIEQLTLDLVAKKMITSQIVLTIGYDVENLKKASLRSMYQGEIKIDAYGREIPKHAHGTTHLDRKTSSTKLITEATLRLFDRIVDNHLLIRRINMAVCDLISESQAHPELEYTQINLFSDFHTLKERSEKEEIELEKEKKLQQVIIDIKEKYGKNKLVKLMSLEEGATAMQRNNQVGGHHA